MHMKASEFMRKAFVLFAVFLMCVAPAQSRSVDAPPTLSARDLQADLAILKKAYEELHPGLYRYNSKEQMAANFHSLATELNRDLTLQQAYLAFSTFLAKIKCGHSYPNFYNQPKTVAQTLFQNPDRVPFYFRWVKGRMVVTRDFSADKKLAPGTEVFAINGAPVKTILARLMTVARADGSNDAKRIRYLEVTGESNYEAFDIYFPLFFPQSSSRIKLQIKSPLASEKTTVSLPALTYEQRLAPIKAAMEAQRGSEPLWEFKFLDERTAYLRMPTWAVFNSKWDWKGFLATIFDQMAQKKTANLILDLRGNEGGTSVGDVILSRLIKQDLRLEQFKRLVRYRKVSESLVPYLDTWDRSFENWGDAAVDWNNGFYTLKKYDDDAKGSLIKASDRPFAGRTFVLVDASCSSATFEFAQAAQQSKRATLVGQPTGGNQRGINGGAFFFLRLPHSKIEIDLPLIGSYPEGARPDAGIRPDIVIQPRVEDIARGIDTELEALKRRL